MNETEFDGIENAENDSSYYQSDEFLQQLVASGDALLTDSEVSAERMEVEAMDHWSDDLLDPEDLLEIENWVNERYERLVKRNAERNSDGKDQW